MKIEFYLFQNQFKTDLYVSSVYTEIICTIGLFAHFRNSYRLIRVFNLFQGINCIFSLYLSIRVFSLTLLCVLNLTLLYVGSKFERYLKRRQQRPSDEGRAERNDTRNQLEIPTISRNSLQSMRTPYVDPCPAYEPPPTYQEVLTSIPKIEIDTSSS